MGIAEKKAKRAASETLATATADVNNKSGLALECEIDYAPIEDNLDALAKAGVVPKRILEYIGELTADPDYKEVFEDVKTIKFVPRDKDGFNYETSAALAGAAMTIGYLPMESMHGGYERAIKGLF